MFRYFTFLSAYDIVFFGSTGMYKNPQKALSMSYSGSFVCLSVLLFVFVCLSVCLSAFLCLSVCPHLSFILPLFPSSLHSHLLLVAGTFVPYPHMTSVENASCLSWVLYMTSTTSSAIASYSISKPGKKILLRPIYGYIFFSLEVAKIAYFL